MIRIICLRLRMLITTWSRSGKQYLSAKACFFILEFHAKERHDTSAALQAGWFGRGLKETFLISILRLEFSIVSLTFQIQIHAQG
jgi:hypothetical protein